MASDRTTRCRVAAAIPSSSIGELLPDEAKAPEDIESLTPTVLSPDVGHDDTWRKAPRGMRDTAEQMSRDIQGLGGRSIERCLARATEAFDSLRAPRGRQEPHRRRGRESADFGVEPVPPVARGDASGVAQVDSALIQGPERCPDGVSQ